MGDRGGIAAGRRRGKECPVLTLLKLGCLAAYAGAVVAWAGLLPAAVDWLVGPLETIALAMLAIHAIELAVMFRHVRRYPGSLGASIVLAMLYGVLHWKPLTDRRARETADRQI